MSLEHFHHHASQAESALRRVRAMNDDEVLSFLEKGLEDTSTDSLPQEAVDELVERVARMFSEDKITWSEAGNLFMPWEVNGEKYVSGETIVTKAFRGIFHVGARFGGDSDEDKKVVEGLHQIENIIGQNPQMIHPAQLLDIAAEVHANPRIPEYLSGGVFHSLGYALRFFSDSDYENVIVNRLDFKNKNNFSKTADFLEMMRILYNIGDEYSYGDNIVITRVHDAVAAAVEKGEGSYLLNARARQLLDVMDGAEHVWSDRDSVPFEITPGVYAFNRADGLYIADKAQTPQILNDIAELTSVEREIMASGQRTWSYDDPLMQRRLILYKKIQSIGTVPLKLEHMRYQTGKAEHEDSLDDYRYLMSKPMRNFVKEDFGADITKLPLKEQFYFLSFLKNVTENEVEKAKSFIRTFGNDGLRTFLAISVDPAVADEVLEFTIVASKEKATKVFEAFASLTNEIDVLEEYLKKTFGGESRQIVHQLTERVLIRARKLLGEAHQYRNDPEKLTSLVEGIRVDTQLFSDACRLLKERGELNPKEIAGSEFITVPGGSFKGALRKLVGDMLRIQAEQYGPYGADYQDKHPELFATLERTLKEHISDSGKNSRFYLYQHEGTLVGFFRFDDQFDENGTLVRKHMASVMGDPKYQGGKLIETLLEQTLKKERDVPINAECDPTKPITQKYLSMGFVKKGEREELGLPIWSIELPAKQPVSKEENSTER